jgi:probable HAF family extracellular repeat protein
MTRPTLPSCRFPQTLGQFAALALATTALAGGPQWQVTITDLGVLPGGLFSSAYAINDSGTVVGVSSMTGGTLKTVMWQNGTISLLPAPVGGGTAIPEDINDAGEIAGRYTVGADLSYGVYWTPDGTPTLLPPLPGGIQAFVIAHAINASGQVVGRGQQSAPNYFGHAVVWNTTEFQSDLGVMGGGTFSEAYGINDLGIVVGVAAISSGAQRAFRWQDGVYTDLSTWPGGSVASKAYAINNAGVIVGLNNNVASVWKNGSVQPLPMPPGVSAFTPAIDINEAGDIIATGTKIFPVEVGVVWKNGQPIALGTLPGGTISRARRINDAGEIVGEANAANGFFHAVKWTVTPVGEPCVGDINSSGAVDAADLAVVLGAWGSTSAASDLNDDGIVNAADLAVLLGAWGACG